MHPNLFGLALRPPFEAGVLEVSNKLRLRGTNGGNFGRMGNDLPF